jgi:glucosyl-dolichyl phosphate glucuronosyltransferase
MKVSVVISTYKPKKPETLFSLLESLNGQSYGDLEVLVVVDENRELCEKIDRLIKEKWDPGRLRTVFNPENKGLSSSRNRGVMDSSGEVVAFIDDDAVPERDWVKNIVETLREFPAAASVVGDTRPRWESGRMAWFPRELYWMISCSYTMTPTVKQKVERGFGVNMAFRKNALVRAGLFNPSFGISGKRWLGGDEIVVFMNIIRAGEDIIFNPDVIVYHDVYAARIAYGNIVRRAFNQGVTVRLYKTLPHYRIRNSVENKYLHTLLFEFYPRSIVRLFRTLSPVELKRMAYVTSVILAQGTGYTYSSVTLLVKRIFKASGTSSRPR